MNCGLHGIDFFFAQMADGVPITVGGFMTDAVFILELPVCILPASVRTSA